MITVTVEEIKTNSRIDATDEDTYIEHLGETAEAIVEKYINQTWSDVACTYGKIPFPLKHAVLLVADHLYNHRGMTENVQLSAVPLALGMINKYKKLVTDEDEEDDE